MRPQTNSLLYNKMILVIDNYDSFTYNLVQYLGELGAEVVVRRNDQFLLKTLRHNCAGQNRYLARAGCSR